MFGYPVIAYLFLGGVGGGTCAVVSALGLLIPREMLAGKARESYEAFNRAGYLAATLALILGALCLLSDGINLSAIEHLFFNPRLTYISVGAYALAACIALCFALALAWTQGIAFFGKAVYALRFCQILGAVLGFVVVGYTGLFLYFMKAVPLWHSPWLPVLFVLSSLSCGLVTALATLNLTGLTPSFAGAARHLAMLDVVALALEIVAAASYIADIAFATTEGATGVSLALSARTLLAGPESWAFWGGFVLVGLLVALVFDITFIIRGSYRDRSYFALLPSCCVLVGAFAMRMCIILAGCHPIVGLLGA